MFGFSEGVCDSGSLVTPTLQWLPTIASRCSTKVVRSILFTMEYVFLLDLVFNLQVCLPILVFEVCDSAVCVANKKICGLCRLSCVRRPHFRFGTLATAS